MKTQFYLFSTKGCTSERFFCGNIYEALPFETMRYNGKVITFSECVSLGFCKMFDNRQSANNYSRSEEGYLEAANNYARRAEESAEYYGCEGVDDMRFES